MATDNTNFIPSVWSARLLANLDKAQVFAQPAVVNRDYEGEITGQGSVVKINQVEKSFASHQNCRCTMLPFIDKNYLSEGAEEFTKLSEADQKLILGPRAFE